MNIKLAQALKASVLIRLLYVAFGFINSILLARLLGVESYGLYVFSMSLVTLLVIPTQLGLPTLITREIAKVQNKCELKYIKGLLIRSHQFTFILSFLAFLALFIFLKYNPLSYSEVKVFTLLISVILIPILSLGAIRDSIFRGVKQVIKAQLSENIIRPFLFMVGLSYLIIIEVDNISVTNILFYYIFCSTTSFLIMWYVCIRTKVMALRRLDAKFKTKKWISAALPIGLTSGVNILNAQISILILGYLNFDEGSALFRVAVLGASLMIVVIQVINSAITPYIAEYFSLNRLDLIEELVFKINKIVLVTVLPITLLLIFFGEMFIDYFYGKEFSGAYNIFLILLAGQFINLLFGSVGVILNMAGYERDVLRAVTLALLLNVLLHILLVPDYQAIGSAIASTCCLIFWNVYLWFLVKNKIKIRYYF